MAKYTAHVAVDMGVSVSASGHDAACDEVERLVRAALRYLGDHVAVTIIICTEHKDGQ